MTQSAPPPLPQSSGLFARIRTLPRSMQWLLGLVVVVLAYFFAVEPALDHINMRAASNARMATELDAQRKLAAQSETSGAELERTWLAFGTTSPLTEPQSASTAIQALSRQVDQAARNHSVTIRTRSERQLAPVPNAEFRSEKVSRVALEVRAEGETAQVMGMLRELESDPTLSGIASLRLSKASASTTADGQGLLVVTFVPEIWLRQSSSTSAFTPASQPTPTTAEPTSDMPAESSTAPIAPANPAPAPQEAAP